MSSSWNLASIWNESLDVEKPREYKAREYCYASELSTSFYDRRFKMAGRTPTTPPNLRSRRKFNGGNLTEFIVLQILARAGVLQSNQEYITYEGEPLRVTGRADFVAGGKIQLLSESDLQALPEAFADAAESIVAQLQKTHPEGLREVNIEVKSCSGVMFDRYMDAPALHHALQAFHYAFNTKRPTLLVYVSRDDFRLCTWVILPKSKKYMEAYQQDLADMALVLQTPEEDMEQHKEPLLLWDGKKFSSNWKITYSNYLTDYGFEAPEEYDKPAKSFALRLSNVAKKIKAGKELTKVNQKTLEDGYGFYPEAEEIINSLLAVNRKEVKHGL